MSWEKMFFRGQAVYVHIDGSGRPVLEFEGRAEMEDLETDTKV